MLANITKFNTSSIENGDTRSDVLLD